MNVVYILDIGLKSKSSEWKKFLQKNKLQKQQNVGIMTLFKKYNSDETCIEVCIQFGTDRYYLQFKQEVFTNFQFTL